ncbi:hypothetical protein C7999DRAFT_44141 [Corynascus novoguineensis]|uniref:Nephrocystin 3-like N-terminal domain-containing protein n=1 Tax=Corynascus novoguineensis TaxID=1126955 RepID=A0AAN7HBX8_9PEZI|nr:hypothetical protein C7999DRAFT_44141 [Corynascus novoguineensis]
MVRFASTEENGFRRLLGELGKPGSGKLTLSKFALKNRESVDGAFTLFFFFHGRGDEPQRMPLGLFRSLLHQVPSQAPGALQDLVEMFEKKTKENGESGKHWKWHEKELLPLLKLSLLKALLKSLSRQSTGLGRFRICFSCRHYPILDLDGNMFEICTEDENQKYISTFVDSQLTAFCTRTSSNIPALIMRTVHSIPPDLDELYQQIIRGTDPASFKLVQLICFATRPLSIFELRWAMLFRQIAHISNPQACQRAEDNSHDNAQMKRRIQSLSRGLAEDFFVEKGLSALDGCGPTETAVRAHFRFSKICIRYLAMKEISQRTPLMYAVRNGHEAVVRLLLNTGKVDPDSKDHHSQTPLIYADSNGHETVDGNVVIVRLLLETDKVDIDARDIHCWTPLMYAAWNGHEVVVRLLLETGKVDVDAKNDDG